MEPVEVTAHFDLDGTVTPLELTWKGSLQQVESTGRSWTDDTGLHILAMTMSGQMYELIYRHRDGHWFIQKAAPNRAVA